MNPPDTFLLAASVPELFAGLMDPAVLVPWLLGMIFGIFVGATPGLTATMAVALIVPFTFYLPNPNAGLALILGISFSAIFAGDIPAVFLRIPGTPASAAAVIDGHELARKGRAHFALSLDLWCSALGGLIGTILLMVAAPQLARFALQFSNFEYFWLGVLGLGLGDLILGQPGFQRAGADVGLVHPQRLGATARHQRALHGGQRAQGGAFTQVQALHRLARCVGQGMHHLRGPQA